MEASSSLLLPSLEDLRLTLGETSRLKDKSLRTGVECVGVTALSRDSNVSLPYSSGTSSGIEVPCDRVFISTSGIELSRDFSESCDLSRADIKMSSGTELSLALCSWPCIPETLMDSLMVSVPCVDRSLWVVLFEGLLATERLVDVRPLRST